MALVRPFGGVAPVIPDDAFVADTATVIGNVTLGAQASIWYGCVVRGDVNVITIGARTNVQDGTVIHCNHDRDGSGGDPCVIGAGVTIGHQALLHACTVEDGAFIGMAAVIMDHAVIEAGAMVAGGAVVTPGKVVRSGELWAGSPARFMRPLSDAEKENLAYSANNYVKLAAAHLADQRAG